MSAPAALAMAKLLVPETEHSQTAGDAPLPRLKVGDNVLDAATRGTTDGLALALNVAAMLIAFVSLIALADWILGGIDARIDGLWLGGAEKTVGEDIEFVGIVPGSLRTLLGTALAPLAFVMGIPWAECPIIGHLLGVKICLNEFVAYIELENAAAAGTISARSEAIATYALCGFANFGSIGIQLGGIGALAPGRRADLAAIALRAMLGGAGASFLTATVAGMLL